MKDEKFIVKSVKPERQFIKVYKDFFRCKNLKPKEKLIYIALKNYLDYGSDEGTVFPTINTICEILGVGEKNVVNTIQSLVDKGVIEKKRVGLTKANIYTLKDSAEMWQADSVEEMKNVAKHNIEGTDEELFKELELRGYTFTKEKEAGTQTDQSSKPTSNKNIYPKKNNTVPKPDCQEKERYSIDDIMELYDYNVMVADCPGIKDDIDTVISILYEVLNSNKNSIRIGGENKPTSIVQAKLIRLNHYDVIYAIHKFGEQTEPIKNVKSYMLTILYNAKEQANLEMKNQVSVDFNS